MPNHPIFTEGQRPEPVSRQSPLVGLEQKVLRVWLDSSPRLRKAYKASPANRHDLETAARLAVWEAHAEELRLRAELKLSPEQAQEFTRPGMWTPPAWPTRRR